MTYAVSKALQEAVFAALSGDAALVTLVGGDIFDAIPGGVLPISYVVIGEEDARDKSDVTACGAEHDLVVSVYSAASGFSVAKDVSAAVCDVLVDANLSLSRGTLVSLRFLRAQARRGQAPDIRRIDLKFRARVDDVLVDANLSLSRGTLVSLRFLRAQARRGQAPDIRRIDLKFRARVDDV